LVSFRYCNAANFLGVFACPQIVNPEFFYLQMANPLISYACQSANHKSANFSLQDREDGKLLLKSLACFMAKPPEIRQQVCPAKFFCFVQSRAF
jgi:hypothetical protein